MNKRIVVLSLVVIILLCACGPSDQTCDGARLQMTDFEDRPLTTIEYQVIMNNNHAQGTVGAVLRDCMEHGWDGWR